MFYTIGAALSHGDDVYGYEYTVTPWYPANYRLISLDTWLDWFITPQGGFNYLNVGRRPLELAIDYIPDDWPLKYCADEANGLSHANGQIYGEFLNPGEGYVFTVAELESRGLWTRLAAKAAQQGLCGP